MFKIYYLVAMPATGSLVFHNIVQVQTDVTTGRDATWLDATDVTGRDVTGRDWTWRDWTWRDWTRRDWT